jgi:hypothetical protein
MKMSDKDRQEITNSFYLTFGYKPESKFMGLALDKAEQYLNSGKSLFEFYWDELESKKLRIQQQEEKRRKKQDTTHLKA